MKPARFDYARPASLDEAVALLTSGAGVVKCLAGGQSLGPMLNLRLVQPDLLVDISRLPELTRVEEEDDGLLLGACTTHAAIEDGRVPDVTGGVLPAVAAGIAYRAVRSRGTIGGSLVHADPAADWISALAALGAEAVVHGSAGRRRIPVVDFMAGVFETVLEPGEILEAVRVPRLGPKARWGFYKVCRKTGEFAHAIGAVLHDPARGVCRAVVGATDSRPIVLDDAGPLLKGVDRAAVFGLLRERGLGGDAYNLQIHAVALERALRQAS
jgi:carbon-monoxide dehydrogenase medium subunit